MSSSFWVILLGVPLAVLLLYLALAISHMYRATDFIETTGQLMNLALDRHLRNAARILAERIYDWRILAPERHHLLEAGYPPSRYTHLASIMSEALPHGFNHVLE